ncbi:hypothetical protein C8R45DRAFT_943415 [Mycena sanguinolenta]|nr:hypothetical protein C8R45DRAFT_943415 [Mycena sanguinolenta]
MHRAWSPCGGAGGAGAKQPLMRLGADLQITVGVAVGLRWGEGAVSIEHGDVCGYEKKCSARSRRAKPRVTWRRAQGAGRLGVRADARAPPLASCRCVRGVGIIGRTRQARDTSDTKTVVVGGWGRQLRGDGVGPREEERESVCGTSDARWGRNGAAEGTSMRNALRIKGRAGTRSTGKARVLVEHPSRAGGSTLRHPKLDAKPSSTRRRSACLNQAVVGRAGSDADTRCIENVLQPTRRWRVYRSIWTWRWIRPRIECTVWEGQGRAKGVGNRPEPQHIGCVNGQ